MGNGRHHNMMVKAYEKKAHGNGSMGNTKLPSPQAPMYDGDKSNLDNRLPANEKPFAKKFYGTKFKRNI